MSSSAPPPLLAEIGQIALSVSDVARSTSFYRDVLGLTHLFSALPGLAFFRSRLGAIDANGTGKGRSGEAKLAAVL